VSFGAELTVQSYLAHVSANAPRLVIAQPCPAIVSFIEIYHPELIPFLAPADSPMLHTMRMVKTYYPQYANHQFAVISPCFAKKREFVATGLGDYNVTMKGLADYFQSKGIKLEGFPATEYGLSVRLCSASFDRPVDTFAPHSNKDREDLRNLGLMLQDHSNEAGMSDIFTHEHVFLGAGHDRNERRTWAVIALCSLMMVAEIIGGSLYGSLALVADGLHMSTHAGAMLIAALAYTYARRHANDPRFVFGTGKLGDLAGFTSAIILALIALLIGYEAVIRFLSPVRIHFGEAIPIAVVGLLVNIVSAWLLGGDDHPGHDQDHDAHHGHGAGDHDNNMRAAYIHVVADAAVSVLAIVGLLLAKGFGWLWMDPLAGIVGALVIANWSYCLIRVTGAILMDISPDDRIADQVRAAVGAAGDQLADLHVWRLGPGHFGAVLSVVTREALRGPAFYHAALRPLKGLSHLTVEVNALPR
jgi:cation diffusion facilitator family transporter